MVDFDEEKSERNLMERGFDFEYAARIFEGWVVEWNSFRNDEHRIKATGQIEGLFLHRHLYVAGWAAENHIGQTRSTAGDRRLWRMRRNQRRLPRAALTGLR